MGKKYAQTPGHKLGPPLGPQPTKEAHRQTPAGYVPTSTNEVSYILFRDASRQTRQSSGAVALVMAVFFTPVLSCFFAGASGLLYR
jgi:hypothetical protein